MSEVKRRPRRYVVRLAPDAFEDMAWQHPRSTRVYDHDAGVVRLVVGATTYEAPAAGEVPC